MSTFLAIIALVISLFIPALLWILYAFFTQRGIFYLIYGLVTYLGLQVILRVSSLQLLRLIPGVETSAWSVFLVAFITVLLAVGGISLIFFVFYKKKMEPYKAVGFALGYACFEPMLLFGVNSFLSLVLNMPLENSSYYGAIFETIYTVSSTFVMILYLAMEVKEDRFKSILWIALLFYALTLFNSLAFNIWGFSEFLRYFFLLLSAGIWIALCFTKRFKAFYGPYFEFLHPKKKTAGNPS